MKYLLVFSFLCTTFIFGQNSDQTSISVAYLLTFNDRHSQSNSLKEYFNLLVKDDKSIFQTYNERESDTLREKNIAIPTNTNEYFSFNKFSILFDDKNLVFNEKVGSEEYQYSESINLKWQLGNKNKEIKGFQCKNAIVNYGGRKWEAWYTLEIPVNAGPYKFKGLPGLIMKITDSTNSYDFEFFKMRKRDIDRIYKFNHYKPEDQRIIMERKEFNKYKQSYDELSLSEKLNIGSTGSKTIIERVDGEADQTMRRVTDSTIGSSDVNPIEIDHHK
ncbi:GLPGLI family protein [Nonlabens agnitus]|uniref:GLPGLI family protein n=1 Tax=Nonlabens agnitus TaxID=870484 RepID=A0A2S9WTN6_9FLAO|nr:GLPGLI family protein [Nonlabens agnitus]PRP66820.1 hypothetical protein BST86_06740 [Nonlabens agnitus]